MMTLPNFPKLQIQSGDLKVGDTPAGTHTAPISTCSSGPKSTTGPFSRSRYFTKDSKSPMRYVFQTQNLALCSVRM